VTAVDTSRTLIRHARAEDPDGSYILADGAALPFSDCCFDLAVTYNSLHNVTDMRGTVRETVRVLRPHGHLCICVRHPFTDLGLFATDHADAPFVSRHSYCEREHRTVEVERDGLTMTFRGWTYTLEDYVRALLDAGLRIEDVSEPQPTEPSSRYARFDRGSYVPEHPRDQAVGGQTT
jgi:SAM-dependent methyltransferase